MKTNTRKETLILLFCGIILSLSGYAQTKLNTIVKHDNFAPISSSSVTIKGIVGQKLDNCILNGIMSKPFELYSLPFKNKLDDGGGFSGEFWGKWFTSAALAYGYHPESAYKAILDKAAAELTAAQDSDGRISSYSRKNDFGFWDVWGRKYVLLGLISHYDQTGSEQSLKAACRATDALIEIAGPGKTKLSETGLQVLEGLSSCSILEPIVLLYERTGNKKYLDFARYTVDLWSKPGKFNPKGIRLIEAANSGTDPIHIASPKGYEMMSCFEGLCELYRVTGDTKLLSAVVKFGESVLKKEIMIVGSGSNSELWCDGANRQTEILEQPMETCVTATWMKFCYQLLRLTGKQVWADQLEISLYNALMGSMINEGQWWAYFSPLQGERVPSPVQVPSCKSSCCVANGPRGMLITPSWSLMKDKSGIVINLYSPGTWKPTLPDGTQLTLVQETDYPVNGEILIHLDLPKPELFTISCRIPAWSLNTRMEINGKEIQCEAGRYARLNRLWKKGDTIRLVLNLKGRIIKSPGSSNDLAIMRGPVVLALDSRLVKEQNYNLWLLPTGTQWNYKDELGGLKYVLPTTSFSEKSFPQYIDLVPVSSKPEKVWMAFEVLFLYRNTHFFKHKELNLIMCDYASAGNAYSNDNLFRVWLPQPLFMNDIFPHQTWKIFYQDHEKRPEMPTS